MPTKIRIALYQPEMPPNTGAIMRLCACFGAALDVIGPCGFVIDDKKLRRVAMDYIDHLDYTMHRGWPEFLEKMGQNRLILLTTKGAMPYNRFEFRDGDILLLGRESAGVPEDIHARADARIVIPMQKEVRSLNVGMTAAIVLAEALRQTANLPGDVLGDIP
jgi:tRNA (cytidine/uridine-2'-O-)-methyltransferase